MRESHVKRVGPILPNAGAVVQHVEILDGHPLPVRPFERIHDHVGARGGQRIAERPDPGGMSIVARPDRIPGGNDQIPVLMDQTVVGPNVPARSFVVAILLQIPDDQLLVPTLVLESELGASAPVHFFPAPPASLVVQILSGDEVPSGLERSEGHEVFGQRIGPPKTELNVLPLGIAFLHHPLGPAHLRRIVGLRFLLVFKCVRGKRKPDLSGLLGSAGLGEHVDDGGLRVAVLRRIGATHNLHLLHAELRKLRGQRIGPRAAHRSERILEGDAIHHIDGLPGVRTSSPEGNPTEVRRRPGGLSHCLLDRIHRPIAQLLRRDQRPTRSHILLDHRTLRLDHDRLDDLQHRRLKRDVYLRGQIGPHRDVLDHRRLIPDHRGLEGMSPTGHVEDHIVPGRIRHRAQFRALDRHGYPGQSFPGLLVMNRPHDLTGSSRPNTDGKDQQEQDRRNEGTSQNAHRSLHGKE